MKYLPYISICPWDFMLSQDSKTPNTPELCYMYILESVWSGSHQQVKRFHTLACSDYCLRIISHPLQAKSCLIFVGPLKSVMLNLHCMNWYVCYVLVLNGAVTCFCSEHWGFSVFKQNGWLLPGSLVHPSMYSIYEQLQHKTVHTVCKLLKRSCLCPVMT
jgi:hypothetical protein